MIFAQLHEALRLEILRRIELGVLSGKLLARQTELNQAHISNFLHRRRMLSLKALDKVLVAQGLTVASLMVSAKSASTRTLRAAETQYDAVPLISQASAIHDRQIRPQEVILEIRLLKGTLNSYPELTSASRRDWQRFVAVRVTALQAEGMWPVLSAHAVVVLDRHYHSLQSARPPLNPLFAVKFKNSLAIRYVNQLGKVLLLRPYNIDYPPIGLDLLPGQTAPDLLLGRVCRIETEA